jgi:Holliday junction resolvasome RuvABC endonuclease subunit
MTKKYRVLGLDIATKTGYAFIVGDSLISYGAIQLNPKHDHRKRFKELRKEVLSLISDLKPNVVVLEGVYHDRNVKTTALLNQYRGVVIEAIVNTIRYESVEASKARALVIPAGYKVKAGTKNKAKEETHPKKSAKKLRAYNWAVEEYSLNDFSFEKDNDTTDAIILAKWFLLNYTK